MQNFSTYFGQLLHFQEFKNHTGITIIVLASHNFQCINVTKNTVVFISACDSKKFNILCLRKKFKVKKNFNTS